MGGGTVRKKETRSSSSRRSQLAPNGDGGGELSGIRRDPSCPASPHHPLAGRDDGCLPEPRPRHAHGRVERMGDVVGEVQRGPQPRDDVGFDLPRPWSDGPREEEVVALPLAQASVVRCREDILRPPPLRMVAEQGRQAERKVEEPVLPPTWLPRIRVRKVCPELGEVGALPTYNAPQPAIVGCGGRGTPGRPASRTHQAYSPGSEGTPPVSARCAAVAMPTGLAHKADTSSMASIAPSVRSGVFDRTPLATIAYDGVPHLRPDVRTHTMGGSCSSLRPARPKAAARGAGFHGDWNGRVERGMLEELESQDPALARTPHPDRHERRHRHDPPAVADLDVRPGRGADRRAPCGSPRDGRPR